MNPFDFAQSYLYLGRRPISFAARPYLRSVYCSTRNLVLRASRQVEKSTALVNLILYHAIRRQGTKILFVTPRWEQALIFSGHRLAPTLKESPVARRVLLGRRGRPQVRNQHFANGSQLFVRAAFHSADAARGVSADLLFVDEFQDIAAGDLPVLAETLSHSARPRIILTGTPKLVDNHLEAMFQQSTACEWTVTCSGCQSPVIFDGRALGPSGLVCPGCQVPLDPAMGCWVPRHPDATWGDGFWINHLMVPWLRYDAILERQRTYDPALFKNECLGLPTILGEHIVTRAELEACCTPLPMAKSLEDVPRLGRQQIIAGIDWGGGGIAATVLTIGFMRSDYKFQVVRFERFAGSEDPDYVLQQVAALCGRFHVRFLAADSGGSGSVFNRLLVDRLKHPNGLYAISYSQADSPPRQEGVLFRWTVNRSASIGVLFGRIKKQTLLFPAVQECGRFLDEFACEVAEYDDYHRTIRYTHPETQPDDALHATNYALLAGLRLASASRCYEMP
jgi:hypothetical protein